LSPYPLAISAVFAGYPYPVLGEGELIVVLGGEEEEEGFVVVVVVLLD
jgi:hypothetical protein